jgi:hypothetical protein
MQLALLDRYAGLDGDRAALAERHARLVETRDALERFDAAVRILTRRLESRGRGARAPRPASRRPRLGRRGRRHRRLVDHA